MTLIFEFILIALFTVTPLCLYFYFTRNFKFWQKLGVPYVKPVPFVGNLKDPVFQKVTIAEYLKNIYDEYSDKPYVGIFSFDKPSLLIRDPELVKNILVKDFQNFMDHQISADEKIDPLWSRTIFVLKGERWRQVRIKVSSVFTSSKMKNMFYLVDTCGKELADYLDKATADGSPVELKETMARFTTDNIASSAFGINSNSFKHTEAEFRKHLKSVFEFSVRKSFASFLQFFAPSLQSLFKMKIVDAATDNFITKTVWSTVEYREKHGVVRNDFVDLIIELRKRRKDEAQEIKLCASNPKKDAKFQISDDEIVAQAFAFLIGAFETSSTTLSFALYELALHSEIQHKLREEILQVLSKYNGKLTYGGIQDMVYLDMVLSETLRKYPPLPFLDRRCTSDYELSAPSGNGTIKLPQQTGVYIPILALHNDPKYFPDPQRFDPDRFTEENKQRRPKYVYIPFGEGPRACIGMRFGLMQVKTGLCYMLSRFEVAPCKDTPRRIVFNPKSFMLQNKGICLLSFKKIE